MIFCRAFIKLVELALDFLMDAPVVSGMKYPASFSFDVDLAVFPDVISGFLHALRSAARSFPYSLRLDTIVHRIPP